MTIATYAKNYFDSTAGKSGSAMLEPISPMAHRQEIKAFKDAGFFQLRIINNCFDQTHTGINYFFPNYAQITSNSGIIENSALINHSLNHVREFLIETVEGIYGIPMLPVNVAKEKELDNFLEKFEAKPKTIFCRKQ